MLPTHVKAVESLIGKLHTIQDHLTEVALMAGPENITEFLNVSKNV